MVLVVKSTYFAFKSRVQLNAFDAVPRRRVLEVASHRACRLTHGSGVAVVITGERRRHCRPGGFGEMVRVIPTPTHWRVPDLDDTLH